RRSSGTDEDGDARSAAARPRRSVPPGAEPLEKPLGLLLVLRVAGHPLGRVDRLLALRAAQILAHLLLQRCHGRPLPSKAGETPGHPARTAMITVASQPAGRPTGARRPCRAIAATACAAGRSPVSNSSRPPGASHCPAPAATRRSTSSPSPPPSRATRASCRRASAGSSGISSVGTYGTLASSRSTRPRDRKSTRLNSNHVKRSY